MKLVFYLLPSEIRGIVILFFNLVDCIIAIGDYRCLEA